MRWAAGSCTLAIAVVTAGTVPAGARSADASSSGLVQQFLAVPNPDPVSYRALRHLDAENDHFHTRAWMDVWTEADDERGFRYEIAAEGGSEFIRSHVFRQTLEMETQMWANGAMRRAAITPANYVLEAGPDATDGPSILLRPRRKDILLVDGFIVLDREGTDLVRMEGLLAKTPSFWTRRVHITRYFQRVAGIRMPVAVDTVANVVVAGKSTLHMSYDYEQVNGSRVGTPQPRTNH